jgi:hypothetical protein
LDVTTLGLVDEHDSILRSDGARHGEAYVVGVVAEVVVGIAQL